MTKFRILHIDDEPDIREVVEISLGLDPGFATRSCGSGEEALVAAIDSVRRADSRLILLSPTGERFNQRKREDLAKRIILKPAKEKKKEEGTPPELGATATLLPRRGCPDL